MWSEVIVIDDSDVELSKDTGCMSDDSEIIVVSVSSPPSEPPASSQPSSLRGTSEIWDQNDREYQNFQEDHLDVEFMDAERLVSASQSRTSQRNGVARASGSQVRNGRRRKSPSEVDGGESDDSLIIEAPKKPTKRQKKTDEEKAREKAEKEAQKLAKKEEAKRNKEAAAAEKAVQKLAQKEHKDANKLISDKKMTLKDMTIELSLELISTPLYASLSTKMREFDCSLQPISDSVVINSLTNHQTDLNSLDMKIIRWKRRIAATYDERKRNWVPLAEAERYTRTEGTYLVYVTGLDVVRSLSRNLPLGALLTITQQVAALRAALGPKHHIHLMLCGWKSTRKSAEVKERVERDLVGLQVREGLFVGQVADEEEAVNWIYNMSADLGIKPHKLIERSHLPFCAQASSAFKVGKSDKDTMAKMLAQLPRLTEPAANAIVHEFGTINRLMEAYERADDGAMMLAHVTIPRTKSGKDAPRALNKALSERLYGVLWGNDPKALVS